MKKTLGLLIIAILYGCHVAEDEDTDSDSATDTDTDSDTDSDVDSDTDSDTDADGDECNYYDGPTSFSCDEVNYFE